MACGVNHGEARIELISAWAVGLFRDLAKRRSRLDMKTAD